MSEWTQEDAAKLAERQHLLYGQSPMGPDMTPDAYIAGADLMRNQLIMQAARNRRAKAVVDSAVMEENQSMKHLMAEADKMMDKLIEANEQQALEIAALKRKK